MNTELKTEFWNRLDDVKAGLLAMDGERPVPMAPQADPDANAIFFVTAKGSAADRAATSGGEASFHVADPGAKIYANVLGKLDVSGNEDKLDKVWSAFAAAWFKDGKADDAVQLVRFTPHEAEVWTTKGGVGYLYDVAKANLTGTRAEGGDHGRLVF